MNCTVLVTVRTASTRLPKKALRKISKKPLIKILIDRIRNTKNVEDVVVCTTKKESDNKLVLYLEKEGIEVFRGHNQDILHRLYDAAKKYDLEQFIVVEGDDLFCEPLFIDETCKELCKTKYEFIIWEKVPFGVSPIGIKTKPLEMLLKNFKTKDVETGWGLFVIRSGLFRVKKLIPRDKKLHRPEIRLTVDYVEDLKLAKEVCNNLSGDFSLHDILNLLDRNKNLLKINKNVKEKYWKNFRDKMFKLGSKNEKK